MTDVDLAGAVAILRRGGVVCFPTETFYGLAADALDEAAVARVLDAKGRAETQPIAVIAPDLDAASRLWIDVPPAARALIEAHWPGPLTIVLPARPTVPRALVGPQGGIGVRVSSHPIAHALAVSFGGPITATSANPAGRPPARVVETARAQLGDAVDGYLDGGTTPGGPASTIVEVASDGSLRIIRQGAIRL
jgi:L-threonylcarbamoyladenylate synthase